MTRIGTGSRGDSDFLGGSPRKQNRDRKDVRRRELENINKRKSYRGND